MSKDSRRLIVPGFLGTRLTRAMSLLAVLARMEARGIRLDQDGKPMKYDLIAVAGWTDWVSACQIVAQNMKDLGIEITVKTPEYNAWYDELGKGQHQWAIGWGSGGPTRKATRNC